MNIDFEKYREARYKEACEALDNLEKERLNKIFAALGSVETFYLPTFHQAETTLENVRSGIELGDRRAMLELLDILIDSLRVFEILPRKVRLAIAGGLENMRDNLDEAKGFLPRKRGERSKKEKRAQEYRVFFTALRVEHYRRDLNISLDDAEARVAEEFNMKQDLVHKYWQQGHQEGKRQITMQQQFTQRIALMPDLFKPGFNIDKMLDILAESANVEQPARKKKKVR